MSRTLQTTLLLAVADLGAGFHLGGALASPRPASVPLRRSAQPAMVLESVTHLLADAKILLDSADPGMVAAAADAANAAADVAQEAGWFDTIVVNPFGAAITALHGFLRSIGVEEAWGGAIIIFTLGVKAVTFPLTKQQIESSTKMQAIAPAAKALQEKYRDRDPARLNAELQDLYTKNQVNPLAGCLPALAQIPLFIGLYRSLLNLAKADKLTESFLWLPSLEGPVSDYTQGISWLTEGWSNGSPSLGWHDTLCYLVLPVLLVVSQYVSTALLTPPEQKNDPSAAQNQASPARSRCLLSVPLPWHDRPTATHSHPSRRRS